MMKKILILLAVLWTAPAFAQVSNTVNPPACGTTSNLNSAGCAAFGSSLYTFLAAEDANRWAEQGFGNAVSEVANANACLGSTSAGLTMTPTSCVAYNDGYRSTETGSITFPDASTCWISMDYNTSGSNAGLPASTRVAGTHYLRDCSSGSAPSEPANAQLLMEVVTSGGAITTVTDLRVPFLNLSFLSMINAGDFVAATTANIVQDMKLYAGGINVSTLEHSIYGSYNNELISAGMKIPSGASSGTGTGNTTPFGCYVQDLAPAYSGGGGTNGVCYYGLSLAVSNNSHVWGANFTADDTVGTTGEIIQALENDIIVNSTSTTAYGLDISGSSTVSPAGGAGIAMFSMDSNLGTHLIPWPVGIDFAAASTVNALLVEPTCLAGAGQCNSMLLDLRGQDSGNVVHDVQMISDSQGGIHIMSKTSSVSGFLDKANTAFATHVLTWLTGVIVGSAADETNAVDSQNGYYTAGRSAIEYTVGASGQLGNLSSSITGSLQQSCDIAVNAGHIVNLVITTDLGGGSCTTAPTFNVADSTGSTLGTAKQAANTTSVVGQSQSLAFAAGDRICIVRTVNGGTCVAPQFEVVMHVSEP